MTNKLGFFSESELISNLPPEATIGSNITYDHISDHSLQVENFLLENQDVLTKEACHYWGFLTYLRHSKQHFITYTKLKKLADMRHRGYTKEEFLLLYNNHEIGNYFYGKYDQYSPQELIDIIEDTILSQFDTDDILSNEYQYPQYCVYEFTYAFMRGFVDNGAREFYRINNTYLKGEIE